MKESSPISLPQLTEDIVTKARKTRLCAYSVALEGWRRGLKLKWYTKDSKHFDDMIVFGVNPPGRLFSLGNGERTHYFLRTRGDKVTNEAVIIGSEKDDTKALLEEKGVPVPKGKGFEADATDDEILTYAEQLGYPLVLKPTDGSLGWGVITNIQSLEELKRELIYVRQELEYDKVIVEQYVVGEEYRFYVVEDEVVAVYNRIPANITGDGEHTIEELIRLKNFERRKNPRLNSCLIEVDIEILEFIAAKNYTLETVLPKGELLYLRQKSNVSIGGDPVDATDDVSDEIKEIAINALKAVPGLTHGGVDIIINDGNVSKEPAVVIELNPTAQIGGILFPLEGKARNIPSAIVDYYFPETKGIDTSDSKVYFDLTNVLEPLENRSAIEVEVTPAPLGKMYRKQFIVSGNVQRQGYHERLKKEALESGLNGYIKRLYYDKIEIVVGGTDLEVVNNFKNVITDPSQNAKITKIKEFNWDKAVKVGFEINERYNTTSFKSANTALRILARDLIIMERDKYQITKVNGYILNSRSWKFSAPLRKIGALIKGKK